jgi:Fe-S cluster assembly protein SufD
MNPSAASATGTQTEQAPYRAAFERLESGLNGLHGSFFHERRQKSQKALEKLGLPTRKTEDWKYTPTGELGRLDLEPAAKANPGDLPALPGWIEGLDAYRMVFANGHWVEAQSLLPEQSGVQVELLSGAMHRDAEAVATWFDSLPRLDSMPFAALNSALYADGVCIRVDRGVVVDKPIVVIDWTQDLGHRGLVLPRHMIVAESGSQVRVLHAPLNADQHVDGASESAAL